ncbi:MAG TPA: FtsX-like permease family protein [Coriobacteriia bacterium]|nr:FtsX-like permease family protein [Coriobacteriia bacterium]
MLSVRIAARFLRTSPVQSALIVAGIAVGIATQVFVGSLITSLQANLVDTTIGSSPHITVKAREDGEPVVLSERVRSVMIADERVEPGAVAPVRTASALFTDGESSAPLSLTGGRLVDLDRIYDLSGRTQAGTPGLGAGEIIIGVDFARKYGLSPGDSVSLVFAGAGATPARVTAVVDLGSAAANERTAFIDSDLLRRISGWSADEHSAIQAQVREPFDAATVAAEWRAALPDVLISDWQAENADLLTALQSQSASSYMIQVFVLVAVALGIASTLAISAVQKTRQIGILKAMGLSDRRSGAIFLWQAAILGVGGTAGGVGLGYALIWGFSLVPVPFSIVPEPRFIALSSAIGVLVALLSSVIPTRKTSRLDPIEVIQSG